MDQDEKSKKETEDVSEISAMSDFPAGLKDYSMTDVVMGEVCDSGMTNGLDVKPKDSLDVNLNDTHDVKPVSGMTNGLDVKPKDSLDVNLNDTHDVKPVSGMTNGLNIKPKDTLHVKPPCMRPGDFVLVQVPSEKLGSSHYAAEITCIDEEGLIWGRFLEKVQNHSNCWRWPAVKKLRDYLIPKDDILLQFENVHTSISGRTILFELH